MIGFIVRRLVWAFLLAAVITLFTFIIFFIIPTDTRSTLSGSGDTDPTLAGQFHLRDKPVTTQYVSFVDHLVVLLVTGGVKALEGPALPGVVRRAGFQYRRFAAVLLNTPRQPPERGLAFRGIGQQADGVLQGERAQPLGLAPDGGARRGRLGGQAVDQQQPAPGSRVRDRGSACIIVCL